MAKKKTKATATPNEDEDFFAPAAGDELEAPTPPPTKATAKRAGITTLPSKVKALSLEDLPADCQREPEGWDDAVQLLMARQAARGARRDLKQARRAARLAFPKLYEDAGKPRV